MQEFTIPGLPEQEPNMAKAQATATKLSWSRAHRLAELVDEGSSSDCRAYLATQNGQAAILDTGKDARTPDIRNLIQGFEEWYGAGNRFNSGKSKKRRAKGDPSKAPRAGAPTERQSPGPRTRGRKSKGGIDFSGLEALRNVQRKHGLTTRDLVEYSLVLGLILDEELDLAQIQREFKQSLKS
jgi:hypothetical protein